MLQRSWTAANIELIRTLDGIDDSSDEDMTEFEQRIAFSRVQATKNSNIKGLEIAVGGDSVTYQPSRELTLGGPQVPVPKQDEFQNPKSPRIRDSFPGRLDPPGVANSPSQPTLAIATATATPFIPPLTVDSSARQPKVKKRRLDVDEKTQSDKKKPRRDFPGTGNGSGPAQQGVPSAPKSTADP